MLISKWDKRLSMEIIEHWLNMINHEGWIPREQILGDEARSKVIQTCFFSFNLIH